MSDSIAICTQTDKEAIDAQVSLAAVNNQYLGYACRFTNSLRFSDMEDSATLGSDMSAISDLREAVLFVLYFILLPSKPKR